MSDDVCDCFRTILEQREAPQIEKMVDGYSGFLFLDDDGMPLVAMHWEHRFNHMVKRYNEIFREQMPNITPHVCRHTYCSIQARAGMYGPRWITVIRSNWLQMRVLRWIWS